MFQALVRWSRLVGLSTTGVNLQRYNISPIIIIHEAKINLGKNYGGNNIKVVRC
jgi:hypothetical protein